MRSLTFVAAVLLALAAPAGAAPIDSDLADARIGGGCHPAGAKPAILDMLTLINPEWAPIVNGPVVDSDPVLVSGTVEAIHGETSGDFPSTHVGSDVVTDVTVDPEHADKVATGNDAPDLMAFEWEVGKYPDWAWPGEGDRIYGLGRHIFDCGHPGGVHGRCSASTTVECVLDTDCRPPTCSTCGALETCEGEHFGYSSEIHPPHAAAAIRQNRGAKLSKRPGARAVPATIADVWVSGDGGGAGDRCVLTHQPMDATLLSVDCYPLHDPVAKVNAQDFTFTMPLPARPSGASKPRWRVLPPPKSGDPRDVGGGRAAVLRIVAHADDPAPSLEVTVLMTQAVNGRLPTGWAGRIVAGWNGGRSRLQHVRVRVQALLVDDALQRSAPLAPKTCSVSSTPCDTAADCPQGESCWGAGPISGWRGQAAANGEWRRFRGDALDTVTNGSVVKQSIVLDQFLPTDGALRIQADAFSRDCIDTMYGQPLSAGVERFGLFKGVVCLGAGSSHPGGHVDVSYPGPDFGTGRHRRKTYETAAVGGSAGGACSVTTTKACLANDECPGGETCVATGGAFRVRYTIERLR